MNSEDRRDLEQPPTSDSIDAFFVFLHLLKGDTELRGQFGLLQSLGEALDSDVATHKSINGIRLFRRHDPISMATS